MWLIVVGVRTRRCSAFLTDDYFDLTSFRLIRDVVGGAGWRMETRNLFVFSLQGDFVLYGVAWKDRDTLFTEISQHSGRELNIVAPERAADVAHLNRHVRRNYEVLRLMAWISALLLAFMLLSGVAVGFREGTSDRWLFVALLVVPLLWIVRLWKK